MEEMLGTVTYVNEELLYFILYEKIYVNAGIYVASNRPFNPSLPKVGDTILLSKYENHHHSKHIRGNRVRTLCRKNSPIDFSQTIHLGQYYCWMIEDYDLGGQDLFRITEMYESIKDNVLPEMNASLMILMCCELRLAQRKKTLVQFGHEQCFNSPVIPHLEFKTISHCEHVQIYGRDYGQFPYWSFGCHWSSQGQVLIGYLFVHPDLGTICIKDRFHTMGCIIMKNDDNQDFTDFINNTVFINKYFILTEIFNPNQKFNLAYICMNFKDVDTSASSKRKRELDTNRDRNVVMLKFLILSKSYPNFTQSKGYHFWLHVEEIETHYLKGMHNSKDKRRCFLCFSKNFIEQWPNLQVANIHSLYFDHKLDGTNDVEYYRINPSLAQFYVPNSMVLSPKQNKLKEDDLIVLDENSIDEILQRTGLISFIATLKLRKFCPPNQSRTSQSNVPPGFGVLGNQTHILDFCVGPSKSLTLYLNNWERLAMPIGLVPLVVVKVRNVYVQNKRYCKSSPLTTLEMVEYRPDVKFSTANLVQDSDWGTILPLELIQHLPERVAIHTIASSFDIIKLSFRRECKKCCHVYTGSGYNCEENGCCGTIHISFTFIFNLQDGETKARIICKNLEILAAFLGFENEHVWNIWKQRMEKVGLYKFRRDTRFTQEDFKEHFDFLLSTNHRLKRNEKKLSNKISILCRKMNADRHFNQDESLWFGLKARLIPKE